MANKAKVASTRDNKKIWIIIILILVFVAGFLVARTRYKPQIEQSFNMIMEREDKITNLQNQITELENKMRLENVQF